MNKKSVISLGVIFVVALAAGNVFGQSVVGSAFKMVGDIETFNNDPNSSWNTAIAEQPTIRLDGSAGALLLGVGDSTAPTWSLTYDAANRAILADADILGFGAGPDAQFASDGTNLDITIATLMTMGDGGSTNYTSVSSTGAILMLGSATATLQDSVELKFGTGGAESEIASNGTDTTWTVSSGDLVLGTDGKLTRIEGAMQLGAVSTFGESDDTPDVGGNTYWKTHSTTDTITDFDAAGAAVIEDGVIIFIVSKGAITYDVTGTGLKGGSTDLVTASGDLTVWLYDGTDWILITFIDLSDDLS